ncbi:hypothetical protein MtrunA17_Chr2g0310661 [Medicago truncatula]|uniref:Uncharacterized protein n=1 Tax=Medicago truncatula TaxID=3880 RepID=A0A396JCX2_MEDTR|nr:hypothetical protein MtrunA17_Chr2g0310661 [Medicago truncatula]
MFSITPVVKSRQASSPSSFLKNISPFFPVPIGWSMPDIGPTSKSLIHDSLTPGSPKTDIDMWNEGLVFS